MRGGEGRCYLSPNERQSGVGHIVVNKDVWPIRAPAQVDSRAIGQVVKCT